MTFKTLLRKRYKVTALDKSISDTLVSQLKGTNKAEQQKMLDSFVASEGITGDDLSDLMYDLGKAGFHTLTKPGQKKSGGGGEEGLFRHSPLMAAIRTGKLNVALGDKLHEEQDKNSPAYQEVYTFFEKNPAEYGKFISAAEKNKIGFYENHLDIPITKEALKHVSDDYIIESILYASVYGQKSIDKEATKYAFEKLKNPLKATEDHYGTGSSGQLLEVAYGHDFDDKLDKWFNELDDATKERIRKNWNGDHDLPA